jgi:uncharacterized protein
MSLVEIPARKGKAGRVRRGQKVKLVNTYGQQVVDTWAFAEGDMGEFLSMEHTHTQLSKILPTTGDTLWSSRRRPILTFVEDNSGGRHDTLIAACDQERYRLLGHQGHHDNCTENLHAALAEIGLESPETPAPLNMFLNIPVTEAGAMEWEESVAPPKSHVVLRAEMDLVIVFSCCPQDLVPINGKDCTPKAAHFEVLG